MLWTDKTWHVSQLWQSFAGMLVGVGFLSLEMALIITQTALATAEMDSKYHQIWWR